MSARDEILARIRDALADAPAPPRAVPVPGPDHAAESAAASLLDLFAERVADYRAVVERCSDDEVEARIAAALASLLADVPDGGRVVRPADLPWPVSGASPDPGLAGADIDAFDAVVTAAAVGIARTGTVVLDHGPGQGRRALSLVPDRHVCVVVADQVVHGVSEALSRLDPSRAQTWISGPSATSDIELHRVEGVHGPRHLHVLIVEPSVASSQ